MEGELPEGHDDAGLPDDDVCEIDDATEPVESTARRRSRGASVNVLGAAMLAVGEILEPEKTTVEIVQTDDDPEPDLPFTLDYGSLPPLD